MNTQSNVIAAPLSSDRQTFKRRLANFVEFVERLPVLRPRMVVLDLAILALFLVQ